MCDCFQNYNGILCENLQCSVADPLACSIYVTSDCSITVISNYCPHFCGKCNSTTCSNTCQNGGHLNAQCACECYQNYNGNSCENILCSLSEPITCASFTSVQCSIPEIYNYCPFLCGKCSTTFISNSTSKVTTTTITYTAIITTSIPVSTNISIKTSVPGSTTSTLGTKINTTINTSKFTTCAPLTCSYAQIQNPMTCACTCLPGFSGTLCQFFNCSSSIQDASECVILTCSTPSEIASCPRKCNVPCTNSITTTASLQTNILVTTTAKSNTNGITISPTTPNVVSGFTITTKFTTCAPLTCSYAQIQNPMTCACTCLPGFSGTLCQFFDCSSQIQDAPECVILTCSTPSEIASCPRQCSAPCLTTSTTKLPTVIITATTTATKNMHTTTLIGQVSDSIKNTTINPLTNLTTLTSLKTTTKLETSEVTGNTSTKTSLVTCSPLICSYGQIQNPSTCACVCSPGFSGTLCHYFDCASTMQDAPECVVLTCSDPTEIISCPRQCSASCFNAQTTTKISFTTSTNTISTIPSKTPTISSSLSTTSNKYTLMTSLSTTTSTTLSTTTSTTIPISSFVYHTCYMISGASCGYLPGDGISIEYTNISSCQTFCSSYTYFAINYWYI